MNSKMFFLLFLLASCREGGGGGDSGLLPPVPSDSDRFVEVGELEPTLRWDKNTFVMRSNETLEQKKDLLNLFEAQAKAWDRTLDHGYIPHLHLSHAKIVYEDKS